MALVLRKLSLHRSWSFLARFVRMLHLQLGSDQCQSDIARHSFLIRYDGRHGAESVLSAISDAIVGKPEAHIADKEGLDFCR